MPIKRSQQELADRCLTLHDRSSAAAPLARASLGSAVAEAAYAVVARAARELLESGTYEAVREALDFGELNSLMTGEV